MNESTTHPKQNKTKKQPPMVMNESIDTNDIHGDQSITREWK
jgi:hypothetical protein